MKKLLTLLVGLTIVFPVMCAIYTAVAIYSLVVELIGLLFGIIVGAFSLK